MGHAGRGAEPTCVVVKHTNPCGIASRDDLQEAYRLAVRADPISAFGGIVAFNRSFPTPPLARPIWDIFVLRPSIWDARVHTQPLFPADEVGMLEKQGMLTCPVLIWIVAIGTMRFWGKLCGTFDPLRMVCFGCVTNTQTLNTFGKSKGLQYRREVDEELAAEIREFRSPTDGETRMFYEIVIAPSYSETGLAKLKGKSKTLRILEAPPRAPSGRSLRQVGGAHQPTYVALWSHLQLHVSPRTDRMATLSSRACMHAAV